MAGISVNLTVEDRFVQDLLKDYLDVLGDLEEPLADWAEYKLAELDEQFDREEDPWGRKWAPLKDETLKRKRIKKILTESSNLRDRFAYDAAPHRVEIGTNVKYAAPHHFGVEFSIISTGATIRLPARPILGVNERDIKELWDILDEAMPQ
jgi:phage virion morphogenesis protein